LYTRADFGLTFTVTGIFASILDSWRSCRFQLLKDMPPKIRFKSIVISLGFLVTSAPRLIHPQLAPGAVSAATRDSAAVDSLPDAPQPQIQIADAQAVQSSAGQQPSSNPSPAASASSQGQSSSQSSSTPADPPADPNGSGVKPVPAQNCPDSQSSSQQPCQQKTRQQEAEEEVKEQEKQRVEGIVPTFNVTYRQNAVPLSPGQKMNLSLHSAIDPFAFASAFLEAGYHEADNDLKGFPWGPKGFFERSGVAYLDTFDGDILATGVFPIVFRQDPRYFRRGYGTIKSRIFYSLSTNFIAKNDYNGKWGPNYGNILGNLATGELSNLYYPAGNSSAGLAVTTAAIQILEGAGGSIFNEFWPDLSRRYLHKDPTHGLDAQVRAQYAADQQEKQKEKAERKQEKKQNHDSNPSPNSNQNQNPN
jgi:hypothetical protein